MAHELKTMKGDSGAPIWVQNHSFINICSIVAIHVGKSIEYFLGKKFVYNKSVKITEKMIRGLTILEKKIN